MIPLAHPKSSNHSIAKLTLAISNAPLVPSCPQS
jgi:hypothetical protein